MTAQVMIPAWEDGILKPVEKLDVHKRGLRHKAVSVFVMHKGRLLIQRRAMEKYHTPGQWANTCCTHPHWGEDAATCAGRRLTEELGFTIDLDHRNQLEYRADVGGGLIEHELVDIFVKETTEPIKLAPNPAEVMDTAWLTLNELTGKIAQNPDKFTPWLRIYVEQHSAQIFGIREHA